MTLRSLLESGAAFGGRRSGDVVDLLPVGVGRHAVADRRVHRGGPLRPRAETQPAGTQLLAGLDRRGRRGRRRGGRRRRGRK